MQTLMKRIVLLAALFACCPSAAARVRQDEAWIRDLVDSLFEKYLHAEEYLTGGVVAVVFPDGSTYLTGRGEADRETHRSFDPSGTTVEIASVSKLITTTALMQLVEQGRVALDRPVADYVGEGVLRGRYARDVLVEHLLTHTSGLDDRSSFMSSASEAEIPDLATYVREDLPPVVWEPGRFFNYSNYAFVLTAYLVQVVSGEPFEQYVQAHVLEPLDMHASGFGFAPRLMQGLMHRYRLRADAQERIFSQDDGINYSNLVGATAFKTTAEDMSHFLGMYLDGGSYAGRRILESATVDDCFRTHFTYASSMPRQQGLGWRIMHRNGATFLYHDGDDTGVESSVVLFPERHLGYFVAFNNPIGADWKSEFRERLVDHLYPVEPAPVVERPSLTPLAELAGHYLSMNDGQTTFEKLGALMGDNGITIEDTGDGIVHVAEYRFAELEPLLFEAAAANSQLVFLRDDEGAIRYLSFGTNTYRRAEWWQDPDVHRPLLLIGLAIVAAALLGSLVRRLRRLLLHRGGAASVALDRMRVWSTVNATLLALFVLGVFVATRTARLGMGIPPLLWVTFTCSLLAALVLPLTLACAVRLLADDRTGAWSKLRNALLAGALLLTLTLLYGYNLVGYHFT
jgi:CubicO group peptidase (beta-lactamase class C family)